MVFAFCFEGFLLFWVGWVVLFVFSWSIECLGCMVFENLMVV